MQTHFNTSHVTVYRFEIQAYKECRKNFNTSHVTVYRQKKRHVSGLRLISIHPMLRFISAPRPSCCCEAGISIHPMLRFIRVELWQTRQYSDISIHPMLRFIKCKKSVCIKSGIISIHPMLRFITMLHVMIDALCDFNTSHVTVYPCNNVPMLILNEHFNTSHVTVYHNISESYIRILTNFNTSHVTVYPLGKHFINFLIIFQYIPCYGLSKWNEAEVAQW